MIETRLPSAVAESEILHAQAYPFAAPTHSYLFLDGADWKLDLDGEGGNLLDARVHGVRGCEPLAAIAESAGLNPQDLLQNRIAVLSVGSNAAPTQLARKFAGVADPVLIPVLRAVLRDYDAVYSAHLTRYGSVPATLAASPGTAVQLFVNLLDPLQLAAMHRSESVGRNYAFSVLQGIDLVLEDGQQLDRVHFYRSHHGLLHDRGEPVALAAIAADQRHYPAMNETEILEWARGQLEPGISLDDFIATIIALPERRARYVSGLADFSMPAGLADYVDIAG